MEYTTPSPAISATVARPAIPLPRESVNAAYAPSEKHAEGAAVSYEELNKRIEALSREITRLREDLGRLKTQEAGTAK